MLTVCACRKQPGEHPQHRLLEGPSLSCWMGAPIIGALCTKNTPLPQRYRRPPILQP